MLCALVVDTLRIDVDAVCIGLGRCALCLLTLSALLVDILCIDAFMLMLFTIADDTACIGC